MATTVMTVIQDGNKVWISAESPKIMEIKF